MALKCSGNVKAVSSKAEFKWEINNFCINCKDVGDCLESPKFVASNIDSNIQWHLRLFPKGDRTKRGAKAENHSFLHLYASTEIKAMVCFKILNNKGKVISNRSTNEFIYSNQFLLRDVVMIPINSISKNDKNTVICEIIVSPCEEKERKMEKGTKRKLENQDDDVLPRLEVFDKYEALFNESKFTDVTLVSEGKAIKAHRCILANSSSVFAAIFNVKVEGTTKAKQEYILAITDIKYNVLLEMIRFAYFGKVNNIDTLAGELVIAADKYALNGLKDLSEMTMIKNLSPENVIDCLHFAKRFHMNKLSEKTIELIVENAKYVMEKPEFKLLPPEILCKVCSLLAKKGK